MVISGVVAGMAASALGQARNVDLGFLDVVPSILAYGAYGLAVLLMYLVYRVMRALVANPRAPKSMYWLMGGYLAISLGFLATAAFMQSRPVKLALTVRPWRDEPVAILTFQGKMLELENGAGMVDVHENENVIFDVDPVITKLNTCRENLRGRLSVAAQGSAELGVGDAP